MGFTVRYSSSFSISTSNLTVCPSILTPSLQHISEDSSEIAFLLGKIHHVPFFLLSPANSCPVENYNQYAPQPPAPPNHTDSPALVTAPSMLCVFGNLWKPTSRKRPFFHCEQLLEAVVKKKMSVIF